MKPASDDDIAFTKVALPYGWLGNMSPHPVFYQGAKWPTTEHLFQALRITDPKRREEIRQLPSPMGAKMKAKGMRNANKNTPGFLNHQELDNTDINNMKMMLNLKIAQHDVLLRNLINTRERLIVEDIGARPGERAGFWGARKIDGIWVGQNRLGTMWMDLRKEIEAWKATAAEESPLPNFLLPFTKNAQEKQN
jgi:predicted NAD-dependent protein-ADP-ribosyltransferase YbiA (DUF1768 family)